MLLALDTSTNTASIALIRDGALAVELTWQVGQRHSTELLTRLDWLFDSTGVAPADLLGIAVATGPGSFNGVRVAVTAAKSLAFAVGASLVAIPTLDVIAWGHAQAGGLLCAVLEAGRGEVYSAVYSGPMGSPAECAPLDGYALRTPEALAAVIREHGLPALICGEWRPETRVSIEAALAAHPGAAEVRFAGPPGIRRAGWLAELATARPPATTAEDVAAVEPFYLRRPAITSSTRHRPPPVSGPDEPPVADHEPHQDRAERTRQDGTPDGRGASRAL